MITLEYPLSTPTATLILPDPILLETDSQSRAIIKRVARGGVVYSFVNYPVDKNITVFSVAWNNLRKAKALEVGAFFWDMDDNYVRYTDYNDEPWIMSILDAEVPIASRFGDYDCELYEFEFTALRWPDA